jgi:hypothetical protein
MSNGEMRTIRVAVLPGSNSCKPGVIGLHRDRQVRASRAATTWGYDPFAGRMLGDFPQAYSHVGLICYALESHTRDVSSNGASARLPSVQTKAVPTEIDTLVDSPDWRGPNLPLLALGDAVAPRSF